MLAKDLGIKSVHDTITRIFHYEGTDTGNEFVMLCPFPEHNDSTPSASVNLTTGLFHCFSCGKAGDIVKLGMLALNKPYEDVVQLLKPNTPEALITMIESKMDRLKPSQVRALDIPPLDAYQMEGPWGELRSRGFTFSTIRRWDLRFAPEQKMLKRNGDQFTIRNSIVIPVMDERGRVLFYCYRRTAKSPSWQPKYLYSSEAMVRHTLFGMQFNAKAQDIVVVEGALDAMWCDQCGVPAVALLGSQASSKTSRTKLRRLEGYRSVTLLGDWDDAGANAVRRIGRELAGKVPVRIARWRPWMRAEDPQELHPVDLEIIVSSAIPWAQWQILTKGA